MLNQIYIHYINTLFVLESFIISCWLLKGKKIGIGIGIGQFARKKSVSESATKNHDRCITTTDDKHSYIYIYAFSRRFYPKRLKAFRLYIFFISMCVPWELNPQSFALLMQCSTTEPQEHKHS